MEELKNKIITFHVHTKYSYDSMLNPKEVVDFLFEKGIKGVIITDHDSISGAKIAKDYAIKKYGPEFKVIIGEEISTDVGDIIGFPLKKKIRPGNYEAVLKEIKKQKGFCVLPHPFNTHNLPEIHKKSFLTKIDFIETFNSRCNHDQNFLANNLANLHNIKKINGSDAHLRNELENVSFEFDNNFLAKKILKKHSKKSNVRISQMIKNYKKKKFIKVLKYLILYFMNKVNFNEN
jgi:predicted metal-dependent phosphoesterase TrpH